MKPVRDREARFAGICGIIALVLGLGEVICGFVLLGFEIKNGDGLWSGFGMMVAGAIGVLIWWTKFRQAMMVFLIMCVMLVVGLIIQIALAVIGFVYWRHFVQASANCYLYYGYCRCTTNDGERLKNPLESCDLIKIFDDVYLAIILFSILGFLVTTTGSFIGCLSTCFEELQEPKRQLTVLTQPTDLEMENTYNAEQIKPEPKPENETTSSGSNKKLYENEVMENEKEGNKYEKENEYENENEYEYEEIVIEKTVEQVSVKEGTGMESLS